MNRPFLILAAIIFSISSCAFLRFQTTRTTLSGGEATVYNSSNKSFSLSIPNLTPKQLEDFSFGNRIFNTNWVTAPASTTTFDGLGPIFNRVSCSACHLRDGRGKAPESGEMMDSMLIRLSIAGEADNSGIKAHPAYGDQLQDHAILGVKPEGYATITYEEIEGTYRDGSKYSLRKPTYHFNNLNYGSLDDALFSPRVAPAVFGLGLLEIIPQEDILKSEDIDDKNNDGISGKANWVWNQENQRNELGRFGWKANQPNIKQQLAGAFNGDVGMTTTMFPKSKCTAKQKDCAKAISGGNPEISDDFIEKLTNYTKTIAVPAARNVNDPQVIKGERIFDKAGCAACHTPIFKTGASDIPQLSNQTIFPYTDLLLHDMGDGLADGRPDYLANGNEWRTPPLWGIGLVETVNKHTNFLHDGRARNIEEAILWHGGEAEKSRDNFKNLSKKDRENLIKFLNSL